MLEITLIPLLRDNYAYFLEDASSGQTAIVDPSEADGVLAFLNKRQKPLTYILNTHHHSDHTGGNKVLKAETGARVCGFVDDADRLPGLDRGLSEGELFSLGASQADILFVPGHTRGHLAFYFEKDRALFSGDTLFSLGCGRLFEGTAQEMWRSLSKLAALPEDTRLYCGHEYTLANLKFAEFLFPEDKALQQEKTRLLALREASKPTIPSTLKFEKRFNPFLLFQKRPCEEGLQESDIFALRRRLKDTVSF